MVLRANLIMLIVLWFSQSLDAPFLGSAITKDLVHSVGHMTVSSLHCIVISGSPPAFLVVVTKGMALNRSCPNFIYLVWLGIVCKWVILGYKPNEI